MQHVLNSKKSVDTAPVRFNEKDLNIVGRGVIYCNLKKSKDNGGEAATKYYVHKKKFTHGVLLMTLPKPRL